MNKELDSMAKGTSQSPPRSRLRLPLGRWARVPILGVGLAGGYPHWQFGGSAASGAAATRASFFTPIGCFCPAFSLAPGYHPFRIAASSSLSATELFIACTTKRLPSPRSASAIPMFARENRRLHATKIRTSLTPIVRVISHISPKPDAVYWLFRTLCGAALLTSSCALTFWICDSCSSNALSMNFRNIANGSINNTKMASANADLSRDTDARCRYVPHAQKHHRSGNNLSGHGWCPKTLSR